MATSADGRGYWLLATDGKVCGYGDARTYAPKPGPRATVVAVAIEETPDGKGYWELRSTGRVIAFGDAQLFKHTSGPAVGPAASFADL